MAFNDRWNRRTFLGTLGALVGRFSADARLLHYHLPAGGKAASSPASVQPETSTRIGRNHGHQRQGTMTVLGGSLMRPEVEAVMVLAGRHFVSVPELEVAAASALQKCSSCRRDTGAIVTSGAAARCSRGSRHPNG